MVHNKKKIIIEKPVTKTVVKLINFKVMGLIRLQFKKVNQKRWLLIALKRVN